MKFAGQILAISIMVALTGCSTESSVNVDKKGNIEIKEKDGKGKIKLGKAKWDKEKMYGLEAPKANLDGFISNNEGSSYTLSKMKEEDIVAYIQKIKDAGFIYNYVSMDNFNYTGTNKGGQMISFVYSKDNKSGVILAGKGEKPTGEGAGMIMEGENAKWDSAKMAGLPDPGVKITSFTSGETINSYTFAKMDNPKEYIEEIKLIGFTIEPSEIESSDGIIYNAKNDKRDEITFTSSSNGCSISLTRAGH
ncbi:hypothetical protein [Bacillus sp. JJ1764]|uniref:hypothetical protein n=1 Tax=Bacillus sp. JJ1764 TaxID=3122964 RepID=UPI00300084E1